MRRLKFSCPFARTGPPIFRAISSANGFTKYLTHYTGALRHVPAECKLQTRPYVAAARCVSRTSFRLWLGWTLRRRVRDQARSCLLLHTRQPVRLHHRQRNPRLDRGAGTDARRVERFLFELSPISPRCSRPPHSPPMLTFTTAYLESLRCFQCLLQEQEKLSAYEAAPEPGPSAVLARSRIAQAAGTSPRPSQPRMGHTVPRCEAACGAFAYAGTDEWYRGGQPIGFA